MIGGHCTCARRQPLQHMPLATNMRREPLILRSPEHCRVSHYVVSRGEGEPWAAWRNFQHWLRGARASYPSTVIA